MTLLQPDPPPSVGNTPPIPKKGGVELAGMFSHAPPVMIVGTGRSGSSYIAKLLQHVQIECGHENWWTPMASRQRFELDADSSWMAAPWVGDVVR